ncbi:unnamed protein product [Phytophthora fragariaefolia]|uniref:Unnamed protein product n=1 Tax=Phytophthora fragariaefolia TaxID=1490495 RepID=A0A9W6TQY2_9STRA|nr:unnamed protein product [Phytophthora fragariaefolia]
MASAKYEGIDFAKLDVDELNDTTSKAGVRVRAGFHCYDTDLPHSDKLVCPGVVLLSAAVDAYVLLLQGWQVPAVPLGKTCMFVE